MDSRWLLLAGGIFWTANSLGVGLWLGFRVARHRGQAAAAANASAELQARGAHGPTTAQVWAEGAAQSEEAARQAQHLVALCVGPAPASREKLVPAIRQLTASVLRLHVQVGSMCATLESFWRASQTAGDPQPALAPYDRRAAGELVDLVGRRPFKPGDGAASMRFPYPCRQWAAPCLDGRLPEADDFFAVRCRELDQDGVVFYVDAMLPAETLVISLGDADGLIFMLARVTNEQAQTVEAPAKYLLECRFIRRIEEPAYAWNAATGAIQRAFS